MIEIRRQNQGRARTKFGILLSPLKPRYQKVLMENPIIKKNSDDDRFIRCILRMEDSRISVSHLTRPYINHVDKSVTKFHDVKKSFKFLDWECAYCKVHIKTEIHNYDPTNFTCKKCYDYYVKNSRFINQRIIDASLKFTDHHKKMLKSDQAKFIKYIKQNDAS
jgi:hypothetical protein